MTTAFVGLGSNLDDPVLQVTQACAEIAAIEKVRLIKISSLYQSPPMGPADQPDYINAVAEIATSLTPAELLVALQAIEKHHGRVRSAQRWSARTLDLDILLYGEKLINSASLVIPHLGLYERAFVLYPLLEIAPQLVVPGHGAIAELVQKCKRGGLKVVGSVSSLNNNDNEN
ncbi:MAG: 2-amino-4-hydroxy-6-hydroxymethyldihydropteridine diphosphokinase [Gammaproteobacteria bacterium]|jgi:2-amino-4-hydroxy-6-hydroxymethyldihydropteridine diphosphokinase